MSKFVWSPIIWEKGIRRNENFKHADYVALDFDDGMSLVEAIDIFRDLKCVIGTTKSHLKPKSGIINDRYRLLIKLETRITDKDVYKETVQSFINRYQCDPACSDGARYFWPCLNIVYLNPHGICQEPIDPPDKTIYTYRTLEIIQEEFSKKGGVKGLSGWLKDFLEKGVVPKFMGGRNHACYSAAIKLLARGLVPSDVVNLIWKAPFDKESKGSDGKGYNRIELERSCESALKYLREQLAKEERNTNGNYWRRKEREKQRQWLTNQVRSKST